MPAAPTLYQRLYQIHTSTLHKGGLLFWGCQQLKRCVLTSAAEVFSWFFFISKGVDWSPSVCHGVLKGGVVVSINQMVWSTKILPILINTHQVNWKLIWIGDTFNKNNVYTNWTALQNPSCSYSALLWGINGITYCSNIGRRALLYMATQLGLLLSKSVRNMHILYDQNHGDPGDDPGDGISEILIQWRIKPEYSSKSYTQNQYCWIAYLCRIFNWRLSI